jgi:HlyD family secretion protein
MTGTPGSGSQAGTGQQQGGSNAQAGGQGRQGWGGFNRQKMGMVWIKQGTLLIPRRVKTGISDNSFTEVEGSLKEGDELITGVVNTNPSQPTTQQQNPFAPQMGRPGQPGGGAGRGGR